MKKIYEEKLQTSEAVIQTKHSDNIGMLWNVVSIIGLGFCAAIVVWGWRTGILRSSAALQQFIQQFGKGGALMFVIFQAVQVVFPILPGGVSCLVGVIFFGKWLGFLYNYIGICAGSLCAFSISKIWGRRVLVSIFSEKKILRYDAWTEDKHRFLKLFAICIFFPVAPDDFLCYLAGTTSMTWKQFILIILLGKPASIALYSMGLNIIFKLFLPNW